MPGHGCWDDEPLGIRMARAKSGRTAPEATGGTKSVAAGKHRLRMAIPAADCISVVSMQGPVSKLLGGGG